MVVSMARQRNAPEAHQLTTLPSGLRVISERIPNIRSAALGFSIGTGSALETKSQAGLSHLLEHMLFRGTDRHTSEELIQILDGMGADYNAFTNKEDTSLHIRLLGHNLQQAFQIMSGMVWRPSFENLETEREIVLEEIAMYEDDPQDKALSLLEKATYGTHPYGLPICGTAEVVGSTTLRKLRTFHSQRYQPQDIVITAAGEVEHEALLEMVSVSLSGAVTGGASPAPKPKRAPLNFARRIDFFTKDTEQYHLCLGGRGLAYSDSEQRRYTSRVLNTILGGTSSSRLNQEVRERRGLAYSIFSFGSNHSYAGEVGIYVGTRPDNMAEVLEVIAKELRRFADDPASEEELVRAREHLKGKMVLSLESTSGRAQRLGGLVLRDLPILSIDEMLAQMDAVSMNDIRELAQELYRPEGLSVVGVGPDEAAFRTAIEPLNVTDR